MTGHDLADQLGTVETAALEFKESGSDRRKLSQTICAFANDLPRLGGGDLLVGVDDAGRPTGTADLSDGAQLALTEIRDAGEIIDRPSMTVVPAVFATLRNYQSLMPLAHDARKPMFDLRSADGVIGSTQALVQRCYKDYRNLAGEVLDRLDLADEESSVR